VRKYIFKTAEFLFQYKKRDSNLNVLLLIFSAISPTSISDVVGQHDKTGDITFRAALVFM